MNKNNYWVYLFIFSHTWGS